MVATTLEAPWTVRDCDFPHEAQPAEKLRFLLNYAVLAPSGHNTQPWLFKVIDDEVELYADRTRALPVVDPGDRELVMSCGAALFHLRVAMEHFGYRPIVRVLPDLDDPDLLAFVRLGERREAGDGPTAETERLFTAIKRRHTNRQAFRPDPIPDAEIAALDRAAREEGAHLFVLQGPVQKRTLAMLIAAGDRQQAADVHFRRELAAWVHPNRGRYRDGMPGYAYGVGNLLSYAGPLVMRTFDWGDGQAARDQQLAEGSPALLILSTDTDTPMGHLAAGQAVARVLLTACAYGLSASFLNQPVEIPDLRRKVAEKVDGTYPQLILRVGYGPEVRPTPRRPVQDVLRQAADYL